MSRVGDLLRCEICGTTVHRSSPTAQQWEWFTGTLDRTHHYCPKHKDSDAAKTMFSKSREQK